MSSWPSWPMLISPARVAAIAPTATSSSGAIVVSVRPQAPGERRLPSSSARPHRRRRPAGRRDDEHGRDEATEARPTDRRPTYERRPSARRRGRLTHRTPPISSPMRSMSASVAGASRRGCCPRGSRRCGRPGRGSPRARSRSAARRCRRSAAARRRWPMNSIAPTSRPRVGWAATSTVGLGGQLAGEHDALLVAARQRRERGVRAGAGDAELGDQLARAPAPPAARSTRAERRRRGRARRAQRFSATLRSSTHPASWRSSGISPMPAAPIAPARPVGTARAVDLDACRRRGGSRLPSTSASSACPLPSTPATPTISPAWTSRSRSIEDRAVRARVDDGVGDRAAPARPPVGTGAAADVGRRRSAAVDEPEGERLGAQRDRPPDHRLGQRAGVGVARWPSRRRRGRGAGS